VQSRNGGFVLTKLSPNKAELLPGAMRSVFNEVLKRANNARID